ncbi:MAG: hypothetical protein ACRDUY_02370 [Nitriliruptorales bacterium]
MATAMRFARLAGYVFAALALAAAPAIAQEESPSEEEQQEAGVECDPGNAPAGSTTTCAATGLQPMSPFQWTAQFTDGSTAEGEGEADVSGTGAFEVEIADSAPVGGYEVTVTGTSAEGEDYEESHQGLIVPAGGGGESESPSPGEEESPADEGQEEPEAGAQQPPAGGVATGGGGTAGGGPGVLALLGGLLAIGLVTGLMFRRRLLS